MAENAEREAPTDGVANLHLDEVTGERVSKSELKKRQKQRDTERKKAEKAAAAPAKPTKAKKEGQVDETDLSPNVSHRVCRPPLIIGMLIRFPAILRDPKWACQPPATDQATQPIPAQVPHQY